MAKRRTQEEIEDLLQRYDTRGSVTRRGFCESHGVALATLAYYLKRRTMRGVRLARVKLTKQEAPSAERFALVLSNGRRIECAPDQLAQLILAAEQA